MQNVTILAHIAGAIVAAENFNTMFHSVIDETVAEIKRTFAGCEIDLSVEDYD